MALGGSRGDGAGQLRGVHEIMANGPDGSCTHHNDEVAILCVAVKKLSDLAELIDRARTRAAFIESRDEVCT